MGGIFLQIKIVTKIVGLLGFSLLVNIMSGFAASYAEGSDTHRVVANKGTDSSSDRRADDWFSKAGEESKLTKQSAVEKKDAADKEAARYEFLLSDNGYDYYMDTRNARWILMPHSGDEYILDVWVRLTQQDDNADYSYPPKYFLEHYYIRPDKQQIQFLSELEVTGRPDNEIQERSYSMQHWENLVPGSIEDEIYHQVLAKMGKNKLKGKSSHGMSVRDAVEEYLRISL